MISSCRFAPLLMIGCAATPLAHAVSGGVDSFSASATQVTVGDTVDFTVLFSLSTTSWSGGGSNPHEPPPQEGYQERYVNWYSWESETLRSVWLQAGGQSFTDYPALGPGGGYGNAWSFSITFNEPGRFDIDLSGSWQAEVQSGYSSESASRNCYYFDPDAGGDLFCDSWYWQYSDANDWYTIDGSLSAGAIGIEVTAAAVPEPSTYALMLAGLAGVGLVARRRKT